MGGRPSFTKVAEWETAEGTISAHYAEEDGTVRLNIPAAYAVQALFAAPPTGRQKGQDSRLILAPVTPRSLFDDLAVMQTAGTAEKVST
jgi:hypothetical protein